MKVLDLFSGCGGMSLGFEQAGCDIILGIDIWKSALKTFQKNHLNSQIVCGDLSKIEPTTIETKYLKKGVDVIIGGPPCQGFSISGKRDVNDPRNKLYQSFVSYVEYFKPQAFVMENVPNLVSMNKGLVKDTIINEFEAIGYQVTYKILLASDYGVPQNRKRVFFVGLLNSKSKFLFPSPTYFDNKITSRQAISDLPEYELENGSSYTINYQSDYQKEIRQNSDGIFNHQITKHTDKTKQTIALVPDGGNYKSLPKELQETRKVNIAWTRLNSQKPSFTIDTGHRHHFHYKFNRIPTVREAARIQSFPDNFIFYGTKTDQEKQVGNAVPPMLSKILANQLKTHLGKSNV
ncbi:MAG: DNA cytosine methyltransferase [Campylobacterota bacterium]|nr:DNA cytosine methyltransferase [Campylobacterota bacterium]